MKIGAGGNWRRFDEKFDASIVKQTTGVSCVSAVGEMLLQSRGISVSQDRIRDIIGEPADFGSLANCLNRFDISDDKKIWRGIVTDEESLKVIQPKENWAIVLHEPFVMGHAVFVEGITQNGLFKIKDPLDQTSYKMTEKDFLEHWCGEVIFRWFPKK